MSQDHEPIGDRDKYENKDPRCTFPFRPDTGLDYCWSYATHVDGDPKYADLEALCCGCAFWKHEIPKPQEENQDYDQQTPSKRKS